MAKEDYELLKAEISNIANAVNLFPVELQPRIFELLVATLLDHPVAIISKPENQEVTTKEESPTSQIDKSRNYVEEFKSFFAEKVPNGKIPALEFAPLVAYFFKELAPEDNKKKEITKATLEEAYRYVRIKPPSDLQSALTNSKSKRGFLEVGESGGAYKLAPAGTYFVEHELPKK